MDQEIKKAWVEALRSGRYAQGQGKLCHRDHKGVERFCCLGVLCDVLQIPYVEEPNDAGEMRRLYGASRSIFHLPDEAMDRAGLDEDGKVPRERVEHVLVKYGLQQRNVNVAPPPHANPISLALLNDLCVSFHDLADIIEEVL